MTFSWRIYRCSLHILPLSPDSAQMPDVAAHTASLPGSWALTPQRQTTQWVWRWWWWYWAMIVSAAGGSWMAVMMQWGVGRVVGWPSGGPVHRAWGIEHTGRLGGRLHSPGRRKQGERLDKQDTMIITMNSSLNSKKDTFEIYQIEEGLRADFSHGYSQDF